MDPLTQGLLGACLCGAVFSKQLGRWSWLVGFVAGMAADVDWVTNLWMSPLEALACQRQITHTFWFIPIGGFIVALPFMLVPKMRLRRKSLIFAALAGYATHAPLAMLTHDGPTLFWPLDMTRISLDIMPIIDPLFSLILLVGVIGLTIKRSNAVGRLTLLIVGLYIAFAATQHNRAINAQLTLLKNRNQKVQIARVMPTPGNFVIWNSVYKTNSEIRIDLIRVPLFSSKPVMIVEGKRYSLLRQTQIFKKRKITNEHRIAQDIAQFDRFADGFVAPFNPRKPNQLADLRDLMPTQSQAPLWSLKVSYNHPDKPAQLVRRKIDYKVTIQNLWQLIKTAPDHAKPITDYYPKRKD